MERQDSQNLKSDRFCRPPVTSAYGVIGTERYLDNSLLLNCDDDDSSQGYGQLKEAFKALTQYDIFQPYMSEHDFRSSNDDDKIGFGLYAVGIRYQKNFESVQPIKVEFKFPGDDPVAIYSYASVLTSRLASINSDGQRMFDLV